MIWTQEVIELDANPTHALAYIADFSNLPEWDPGVAAAEAFGTSVGPNAKYRVVAKFGGSEVPIDYAVTEYDAGERAVLVGQTPMLWIYDTIGVASDGRGGTRLTWRAELKPKKSWLWLFAPILRWSIRRAGRKAMDGLMKKFGSPVGHAVAETSPV